MKKIVSITLVIIIITVSIPVQPVFAFTPEEFIGNLEWGKMNDVEKWACIFNFTVAEIKAVVKGDAASFIQGMTSMQSFMNNNKPDNFVKDDKITIPKEYVALVKQCIDEYLKTEQTKEENGGFYIMPTMSMYNVPIDWFKNAIQYQSFKGVVAQNGLLAIVPQYGIRNNAFAVCSPYGDGTRNIVFVDAGDSYSLDNYTVDDKARVNVRFYDALRWTYEQYPYKYCNAVSDTPALDLNDGISYPSASTTTYNCYCSYASVNNDHNNTTKGTPFLCSSDGRKIRVFVSEDAVKNYSVGNRKVYVTNNYYDYVPEDLTVSIDDLQKSVSDLQKVIDELLKRVTDKTSEKEIMELLRQILDALRDQQGTGGGGSGGGDVAVNVDLEETNSWLSKIYSKVSQIFEKMGSFIGDAGQTAVDKIQESLDEIIKQLKAIKGWTIADTIIDGADAVADWLGFIRDFLTDAGSGVATISSAMDGATGILKTKFPFCIPWDVYALISFLAHEPETPVFSLPIKLERFGIEEYIEVDLSQFKIVSDISRTLLTLIYCYALLNLTMKIFPMTKEET